MTGASIKVGFQDEEFKGALTRLQEVSRDHRPLLKRLGLGLVDTTHRRFESAKDPEGNSWAALNPLYATEKKGPGILRGSSTRGGLMGGIHYRLDGNGGVRVGSNKIYAAVHQFGAVIKPVRGKALIFRLGGKVIHAKQVVIPARPYLGFGEADHVAAMEAVEVTFQAALTGVAAREFISRQ